VITAAGIQNILTKSLGSTTAHNVVKATVDALLRLKQPERVARLRGKSVADITGADEKKGGARRVHEGGAVAAPVPAPAEPPAGA
jgi:hypothetical protein